MKQFTVLYNCGIWEVYDGVTNDWLYAGRSFEDCMDYISSRTCRPARIGVVA